MAEFISEEHRAAHLAALWHEYHAAKAAGYERLRDIEAELARLGESVEGHAPAVTRRASARKAVVDAAGAAEVRMDASS